MRGRDILLRSGLAFQAGPNASLRTVVWEGDSRTSVANSYARQFEGYAAPPFTSYNVSAISGSTILSLNSRAAANIAKMVKPGANFYIVEIGRNDLSNAATWLPAMAAHCDTMRAAGFFVAIIPTLPATGGFNTQRAIANAEMALWETNGSTVPGKHCDKFLDVRSEFMWLDATASDTNYFYDGTHPTLLGQQLITASLVPWVNALTQSGYVASPQPSVASGIYGSTQNVTLTSATSGASIFYTLDSSNPTTASTPYVGAISVSTSQTIRSIASKAGLSNSAANDAIYTFGTAPSLTDIAAWYKFNAGTLNDTGGVARWEDRLFGRHVVQSVTTMRPANSSGIITFDGSNDFLQRAFLLPQPSTVYALMRQDGWNIVSVAIGAGDGTGNGAMYQYTSSPNLCAYSSGFGPEATQATIGAWVAVCMVLNGASSSIRVNNNAAVTGSVGASPMNGLTLGATAAGSQAARVSFKEVTMYGVAHTTPQQDAEITRLLAI